MAFLRIEDLFGSIEVVVFPKDFELYKALFTEDRKVYIKGRASVTEEEVKLISEMIVPFEKVPKELWIQFANKQEYLECEEKLFSILANYHDEYKGAVPVIVYCREEKAINRLSRNHYVREEEELLAQLLAEYGETNVRVKEKSIENIRR